MALVLPYADLVVCLDGRGGIAAACPPSELSATLALAMNQAASLSVVDDTDGDGDTDGDRGVDVIAKPSQAACDQNAHSAASLPSGEHKKEKAKAKLTRSDSSGFFNLLSAIPILTSNSSTAHTNDRGGQSDDNNGHDTSLPTSENENAHANANANLNLKDKNCSVGDIADPGPADSKESIGGAGGHKII